jgi:hypothetical protein
VQQNDAEKRNKQGTPELDAERLGEADAVTEYTLLVRDLTAPVHQFRTP